jgi:hypothetical protein
MGEFRLPSGSWGTDVFPDWTMKVINDSFTISPVGTDNATRDNETLLSIEHTGNVSAHYSLNIGESINVNGQPGVPTYFGGNLGIMTMYPNHTIDVLGDVNATWYIANGALLTNISIGGIGKWNTDNDIDIFFRNNVSIGEIGSNATLNVNGTIYANDNTDTISVFGRTAIGGLDSGNTDIATMSHLYFNTPNNFAIKQNANGNTEINSNSLLMVNINNNTKISITDVLTTINNNVHINGILTLRDDINFMNNINISSISESFVLLNINSSEHNLDDTGILIERTDELNIAMFWDESDQLYGFVDTPMSNVTGDLLINDYLPVTVDKLRATGNQDPSYFSGTVIVNGSILSPHNMNVLGTVNATEILLNGVPFKDGGESYSEIIKIWDEKISGTNGGPYLISTEWQRRDLTNIQNNLITASVNSVSLESNEFTLLKGNYIISIRSPGYKLNIHRIRLYNITDTQVYYNGTSAYSRAATITGALNTFISIKEAIAAAALDTIAQANLIEETSITVTANLLKDLNDAIALNVVETALQVEQDALIIAAQVEYDAQIAAVLAGPEPISAADLDSRNTLAAAAAGAAALIAAAAAAEVLVVATSTALTTSTALALAAPIVAAAASAEAATAEDILVNAAAAAIVAAEAAAAIKAGIVYTTEEIATNLLNDLNDAIAAKAIRVALRVHNDAVNTKLIIDTAAETIAIIVLNAAISRKQIVDAEAARAAIVAGPEPISAAALDAKNTLAAAAAAAVAVALANALAAANAVAATAAAARDTISAAAVLAIAAAANAVDVTNIIVTANLLKDLNDAIALNVVDTALQVEQQRLIIEAQVAYDAQIAAVLAGPEPISAADLSLKNSTAAAAIAAASVTAALAEAEVMSVAASNKFTTVANLTLAATMAITASATAASTEEMLVDTADIGIEEAEAVAAIVYTLEEIGANILSSFSDAVAAKAIRVALRVHNDAVNTKLIIDTAAETIAIMVLNAKISRKQIVDAEAARAAIVAGPEPISAAHLDSKNTLAAAAAASATLAEATALAAENTIAAAALAGVYTTAATALAVKDTVAALAAAELALLVATNEADAIIIEAANAEAAAAKAVEEAGKTAATTISYIDTYLSISSTKSFCVEHIGLVAKPIDGLGRPLGITGINEYYTSIIIKRIG